MTLRTIFGIPVLWLCILLSSVRSEDDESVNRFPTVGERRLDIVGDEIESIGCVLDVQAILAAKDGEAVVLKHKTDPRGDVTVVFNHVVLPKGQWVLHGAKNSLEGVPSETPPNEFANRMEAVSAILTGRGITTTPRDSALDNAEIYRRVFVMVGRISGWDIKVAHSLSRTSSTHSFGYTVPNQSVVSQMQFAAGRIPIVNILHRNEEGELLAGGLFWFEKSEPAQGEGAEIGEAPPPK